MSRWRAPFASPSYCCPMPSTNALQHLTPRVAALLRGELPDSVLQADAGEVSALAHACVVHGVHGVLYHQFSGTADRWRALPQALRERLERQAKTDLAWELAHQAELMACLAALAGAGVDVLLLKGTALAYALYPVASIRARGDTDLFVRAEDVARLCEVLAARGYVRDSYSQGVGCEVNLTKKDRFGLEHVLDVHWRLSSNEVFAALLDWAEARRMSITVPTLGAHARGLCHVHALAARCVHRAVHVHSPYYVYGEPYLERNRLIWLYDVRLLAEALGAADWSSFVDLARERGVSALCLDALRAATEHLGAAIPERGVRRARSAETLRAIRTASFGQCMAWRVGRVSGAARHRRAVEVSARLCLPGPEYMRRKYPGNLLWPLPYLYLRRVVEGVQRRMRQSTERRRRDNCLDRFVPQRNSADSRKSIYLDPLMHPTVADRRDVPRPRRGMPNCRCSRASIPERNSPAVKRTRTGFLRAARRSLWCCTRFSEK